MATYVLEFAFDRDNTRRVTVRPRHRRYLRELLDQGRLMVAGPWADDHGALIVYNVADEAEARAVLATDPYVEEDVVTVVSLREWHPIFPEQQIAP